MFYALISLSIVLVSLVAGQVISNNIVRMHIHSQISILIEGAPEIVPARIGVVPGLWRNHSLDRYGVDGSSPLVTRDTSGIIHVESNTLRDFTLHDFLSVWGKSLDYSQVVGNPVQPGQSACIVVNGQSISLTDNVVFANGQKIALEIIAGSCSSQSLISNEGRGQSRQKSKMSNSQAAKTC